MSQPVLSGEQLAVQVKDGYLRVTNDPGFSSDNGDGCPYRSVLLLDERGAVVYGRELPARTAPEEVWTGYFSSRDALAAALIPAPNKGTCRLYGGSLFQPWVAGQEGPFTEWGYTDQGKNPSGVARKNEVAFTAQVTPPPDPEPEPPPVWTPTKIGKQHGITAELNWWRLHEPELCARGPGWKENDPGTWPWPERNWRREMILWADHDMVTGVSFVPAPPT